MPRGSRRLPDGCVELLRSADLILHGGDISSSCVLSELRQLGPPVVAVHGNADEAALKKELPVQQVVEVEAARIALVHAPGPAAGRAARLASRFPDCDAVVYGHTHMPQIERVGSLWLLNPGSPTERRRAAARSAMLVQVAEKKLTPRLVTFA